MMHPSISSISTDNHRDLLELFVLQTLSHNFLDATQVFVQFNHIIIWIHVIYGTGVVRLYKSHDKVMTNKATEKIQKGTFNCIISFKVKILSLPQLQ